MNVGKAFFWGLLAVTGLVGGKILWNKINKKGETSTGTGSNTGSNTNTGTGTTTASGNVKVIPNVTMIVAGDQGVNVRTQPQVNNGIINNLIAMFPAKTDIGIFQQAVDGVDGYRWYQVKFKQKTSGKDFGWMRKELIKARNP